MAEQPGEKVYLDENNVLVTSKRAVLSGTTYALNNITSVKMSKKDPDHGCMLILTLAGVLGVLIGIFVLQDGASGWAWVILGAIMAVGGGTVITQSKPDHIVRLGSASGETNALSSKDQAFIMRVTEALNDAIIDRA